MNTQAVNDDQVITEAYVDQFHQEKERSRRDLGLDVYGESGDFVKNSQDIDLNDKKLKNLDTVVVNREPSSANELGQKKYLEKQFFN